MGVLCLLVSECITTLVTGAQKVQNRLLNFLERVTQGHKPPCVQPVSAARPSSALTTDPFLRIPDCLYVFVFTWVQCPWRPEGIGSRIPMTELPGRCEGTSWVLCTALLHWEGGEDWHVWSHFRWVFFLGMNPGDQTQPSPWLLSFKIVPHSLGCP